MKITEEQIYKIIGELNQYAIGHGKAIYGLPQHAENIEDMKNIIVEIIDTSCKAPCGMNYCDENGCTERKRNLVDLAEIPSTNN